VRFAFTDDQLTFRDAVREFLAKECPPELVRRAWEDDTAHAPDLWRALADLGVVGLTVPESAGGLGMNELDLVLLLEECGRAALAEPIAETTAVAAPLLVASGHEEAARWLAGIASGEAIISVVVDDGLASAADVAHAVVVCRDDRVVLVPADGLELTRQLSVDGARRLFSVDWEDGAAVELSAGDDARVIKARMIDHGALACSAQLVGLAEQMLALTVGYVGQRQQFGVPVGSFQAVKHHLADALLAVEFAKPLVYNAAYAMAGSIDTSSRDVSMAKCAASDAARLVARKALQCHGAIAYTVEYDLHLWMKRSWALAASWGDARWHRRRVSESVLGPLRAD
jgi:alkylation response protein AidB-like acyl-CoA dehydrogenase